MTSSSPEAPVRFEAYAVGDLRAGVWTRLAGGSAVGDPVTEGLLAEVAEAAKTAATAQGYAAGWAQGRRAAEERFEAERQQRAAEAAEAAAAHARQAEVRLAALAAAAEEVRAQATQVSEAVAATATGLAIGLVERILGRELHLSATPAADAIARAATLAAGTPLVSVRLHPDDVSEDAAVRLADTGVTIVADPTVSRGSAVATTAASTIEATVEAALRRVVEALAG